MSVPSNLQLLGSVFGKAMPLQTDKISPFIGHAGVGARFEVVDKLNFLALRETTRSQLTLILTLGVPSIVPAWVLAFEANKINGGFFAKSILCISILVTFPFFVKHMIRLLRSRRIEVGYLRQQIRFIPGKIEVCLSFVFQKFKV